MSSARRPPGLTLSSRRRLARRPGSAEQTSRSHGTGGPSADTVQTEIERTRRGRDRSAVEASAAEVQVREFTSPALVTIADEATLTDVLGRARCDEPDGRAVSPTSVDSGANRQPDEWTPVTAAEFLAQVEQLAAGFLAAGLVPGQRVGLLSRTRYEWTLDRLRALACRAGHRAALRDLGARPDPVDSQRFAGCGSRSRIR